MRRSSKVQIALYNPPNSAKLPQLVKTMRKSSSILAVAATAGLLAVGCAGPEQKLGRGINNTLEIVRWGEINRSVEQTALFDAPSQAHTTGLVRGFSRTFARTGVGLLEIVTSPLPPYGPMAKNYLSPNPAYPDCYKPGIGASPVLATDSNMGFSGGDVLPWAPGSRFRVFDNN
jgi:putative exosortase-associated protein (TIGR04073 family)